MKHIVTVARITTVSIDIEVETEHGNLKEANALALAEAENRGDFDDHDGTIKFEVVETQSNEVVTDDRFWDCECKEHYIHPVSQLRCNICKCDQTEMPSSRVNEILEYFGCKPEDLVSPVDVKREVLKQKIIKTINETGRWSATTCPGSKGEACGWDQDIHHALEQLQRRGIPGIHLSWSMSFECCDWVAVKV